MTGLMFQCVDIVIHLRSYKESELGYNASNGVNGTGKLKQIVQNGVPVGSY